MTEDPSPQAGKIETAELLLTASRFEVWRVSQRLADGQLHAREIVKHPGAVVILPILDDGRICLIRNYRIAVDQELENGYVILCRKGHPVGLGLLINGTLRSQLPARELKFLTG